MKGRQGRPDPRGPVINDPKFDKFLRLGKLTEGYVALYTTGSLVQMPDTSIAAETETVACRDRGEVLDVVNQWLDDQVLDSPLAIASGITPENVLEYVAYVDYFLVATGISRDFHHLDPEKMAALATILHGLEDVAHKVGTPEDPAFPKGV